MKKEEWMYFAGCWIKTSTIMSVRGNFHDLVIDVICTPHTGFNCRYETREDFEIAYKEILQHVGIISSREESVN